MLGYWDQRPKFNHIECFQRGLKKVRGAWMVDMIFARWDWKLSSSHRDKKKEPDVREWDLENGLD